MDQTMNEDERMAWELFPDIPASEAASTQMSLEEAGETIKSLTSMLIAARTERDQLKAAAKQSAWKGDPVYRVPSARHDDRNTCRVFHRDIEGRVVAEFFGPNAQAMAEQFCSMFGEPNGSKR
jgi:hypothetical protein